MWLGALMLSNFKFTFADITEIFAFVLSVGGFLWAVFVWQGSKIFASKKSTEKLEDRMEALSKEMKDLKSDIERLPSYNDIQNINKQLSGLENTITAVNGKVDGVGGIVSRVEHQLNLLMQHQINKEK